MTTPLELALKISNQVEGTADVEKLERAVEGVGTAAEKLDAKKGQLDGLTAEMSAAQSKAAALADTAETTGKRLDSLGIQAAVVKTELARMSAEGVKKSSDEYRLLNTALKNIEAEFSRTQSTYKSQQRETNNAARETAALEKQITRTTTSIAAQESALAKHGLDTKELGAEYQRLKTAVEGYAAAQEVEQAKQRLGIRTTQDISAEIQQLRNDYNTLAQSGQASAHDLARANQIVEQRIAALHGGTKQAAQGFGVMDRAAGALLATLSGASLVGFYNKLKDLTIQQQTLEAQMKGMTSSSEDYANIYREMTRVAAEHHKTLGELSLAQSRLLALEDAGIISRKENIALFEGMSNAQSKYGASSAQLEQSLYGLAQALASPVVHAQELNQVVEPLPGLMAKMDAAAGQAAGGFRRFTNDGKISAETMKNVMLGALKEFSGAAAGMADTLKAKTSDMENSIQHFAKSAEPEIGNFIASTTDAFDFWGEKLEEANRRLKNFFIIQDSQSGIIRNFLRQTFHAGLDKEFEDRLERIAQKYGENTEAVSKHAKAIDLDVDSITGLHSAQRITAQVLDGLLEKYHAATAAVKAKTAALVEGKASQGDVDKATQAEKKALADYNVELEKSKTQLDDATKSAAANVAQVEAQATAKISLLESQQQSLQLAAQESEAGGKHVAALEFERQAMEKAGEIKRAEIDRAREMVAARDGEARSYQELADETERTARALDGVTPKEQAGIDAARTSALEKRNQAEAERQHLAELLRHPAAFDQYRSAMLSSNAAVRSAYTEARAAWQEAQRLEDAQRKGAASAEQVSTAEGNAAVALAKLSAATKQAAADQQELAHIQSIVSAATQREVAQASANRQQAAVQSQKAAQQQHAANQSLIRDGEQIQLLTEAFSGAMASYGEIGVKAMNDIQRALGGVGAPFDRYFENVGRWLRDAEQQVIKVDQVTKALQMATQSGVGLSHAIWDAERNFNKLDEQHLSGLNAALDVAKAKMQSLIDMSKSEEQRTQDELDRIMGREDAIARRAAQARIDDLQARLKEASKSGSGEAVRNLETAIRNTQQLQAIQAQQAAKKTADPNAPTLGGGGTAAVPAPIRTVRHLIPIEQGKNLAIDTLENSSDAMTQVVGRLARSRAAAA